MTSDPKPKQSGGARKGAGRKSTVEGKDVRPITVRMSDADREVLEAVGHGSVSRGIQIAARLVKRALLARPARPSKP